MHRNAYYFQSEREITSYAVAVSNFDNLVDAGFDDIVIITPRTRWIASLDEWQDYADLSDDGWYILRTSYMGKA